MGAAASSLSSAEVGKFRLSTDQQKKLDILSNLFQLLLRKNNLMNLGELMATKESICAEMIVTLSSQIEKEFQRLKLEDPVSKTLTDTAFITQEEYTALQKSDVRRIICDQIAEFMVSFVILVAALVASISIPEGLIELEEKVSFFRPQEEVQRKKTLIDPSILRSLVGTNTIKEEYGSNGKMFNIQGKYVLALDRDTPNGILYKRESGLSKIFDIEMSWHKRGTSGTAVAPSGNTYTPSSGSTWGLSPNEAAAANYAFKLEQEKKKIAREQASEKEELKYQQEQLEFQQIRMQAENKIREINFMNKGIRDINQSIINTQRFATGNSYLEGIKEKKRRQQELDAEESDFIRQAELYKTTMTEYSRIQTTLSALESQLENPIKNIQELKKANSDVQIDSFRRVSNNLTSIWKFLETKYGEKKNSASNVASVTGATTVVPRGASGTQVAPFAPGVAPATTVPRGAQVAPFAQARGVPFAPGVAPATVVTRGVPFAPVVQAGGEQQFLLVKVTEIEKNGVETPSDLSEFSTPPPQYSTAQMESFYMDTLGFTYDTTYFNTAAGRLDPKYAVRFETRLKKLFDTPGAFEIKEEGNGDMATTETPFQFGKLDEMLSTIKTSFISYYGQKLSRTDKNIQSPAALRAFLLAEDARDEIKTGICKDPWNNKPLTTIPAYSLLIGLYQLIGENPDISLKSILSITQKEGGSMIFNQQSKEKEDLRSALSHFCTNGFRDAKDKSIISAAYRELQTLYFTQLQNVTQFIQQKLFLVDGKFATTLAAGIPDAPILHLHPSFVKSSASAISTLKGYIKEATDILSKHYMNVENVYTTALQNILNRQKGLQLQKSPKVGGTRRRLQQKRHSSFRKKRVARL